MALRWERPTVDTVFHIDMDWWDEQDRDIRIHMLDMLCDACRDEYIENYGKLEEIDWVDEDTGEVMRVDGLWHSLRTCCSLKPEYISPRTPIVEAVFRTFVANGNRPLTIREIHEKIDRRPPAVLLKILTSGSVYLGIRPVRD